MVNPFAWYSIWCFPIMPPPLDLRWAVLPPSSPRPSSRGRKGTIPPSPIWLSRRPGFVSDASRFGHCHRLDLRPTSAPEYCPDLLCLSATRAPPLWHGTVRCCRPDPGSSAAPSTHDLVLALLLGAIAVSLRCVNLVVYPVVLMHEDRLQGTVQRIWMLVLICFCICSRSKFCAMFRILNSACNGSEKWKQ
jgi:hypothetical protein